MTAASVASCGAAGGAGYRAAAGGAAFGRGRVALQRWPPGSKPVRQHRLPMRCWCRNGRSSAHDVVVRRAAAERT